MLSAGKEMAARSVLGTFLLKKDKPDFAGHELCVSLVGARFLSFGQN
jgi:hypothetical protein